MSTLEALDLKAITVRQYLRACFEELQAQADLLPTGSRGAERLMQEAFTLNDASMIVGRLADEREGRTCMCDGGGSIMHKPSLRCTAYHPEIHDDPPKDEEA